MSVSSGIDSFRVGDGLELKRRRWSAPQPIRSLVLVHGLAEHSERYEHIGRWLAERGYSVHAYDQRGHGASPGPRNHAPSFETLLDDLEHCIARVRGEEPDRPLILLGHSMGGLVVAGLLTQRRPRISASVLSGPALLPESRVGPRALALARLAARLLPRLRLASGIDPEWLSRDPAVVQAYVNDPRIDTRVTLRLATELLRAASSVRARSGDVEIPVLIAHGEADLLCRVEGSREFAAGLRPAGCELRTYPGLRHEILNEPERGQILAEIHAWIEKRVPA